MKKILYTTVFLLAICNTSLANEKKENNKKERKTYVKASNKKSKKQAKTCDLCGYCFKVQQDVKETFTEIYPNEPDFVNSLAFGAFLGCMKGGN
jgi:starvation-inducible outer membrane lipoprotein